MTQLLAVTIGSIAGGLSRYFLGGFAQRASGGDFPVGTLTVNLAGCFIVGVIAEVAGSRIPVSAAVRLLLITGFCGAFTTFSAFMVETDFLIRTSHPWMALLNVALSVVGGFIFFRLGMFLGGLGGAL